MLLPSEKTTMGGCPFRLFSNSRIVFSLKISAAISATVELLFNNNATIVLIPKTVKVVYILGHYHLLKIYKPWLIAVGSAESS